MPLGTGVYNLRNVAIVLDGVPIFQFADGEDVCKLSPASPTFDRSVGADGFSTVSYNNDSWGEVTLVLMQNSLVIPALFLMVRAQELLVETGAPVVPVSFWFEDVRLGQTAPSVAYFMNIPDIPKGQKIGKMEWRLGVPSLRDLMNQTLLGTSTL